MKKPTWQQQGQEPDYRFTLANERTFLAWIRTALAVLAGGVVLDQFADKLGPHGLLLGVATGLTVLAAVLCAMAYARWKGNEQAMRHGSALPAAPVIPVLAFGLMAGGLALGVMLLWR